MTTALNYKTGMLVEHPARPQWGVGKVVGVDEDRVHIIFKGEIEKKAKTLMKAMAPLTLAANQTDDILDILPNPTRETGGWELPHGFEKTLSRHAAAVAKAEALANR